MYDLKGKVALVTGASGELGIGRAIAVRLAKEGANIVINDLVARRAGSPPWRGLPDVVSEIEALGRQTLSVVADVSDAEQVDGMVREALQRFGHIDILVNNAAAPAGRDRVPVVDLEEDAWDRVQQVNAKGTFLCCKAVARAMIDRDQGGKIINMSSQAGEIGMVRYAAYCASKFAIRGFTQSLALELAPHGINVNAVCPSRIETERIDELAAAMMPEGFSVDEYHQQMTRQELSKTPLGRLGKVSDVVQMVAFLASSESDFLTGLSMSVAGGTHMN